MPLHSPLIVALVYGIFDYAHRLIALLPKALLPVCMKYIAQGVT